MFFEKIEFCDLSVGSGQIQTKSDHLIRSSRAIVGSVEGAFAVTQMNELKLTFNSRWKEGDDQRITSFCQ